MGQTLHSYSRQKELGAFYTPPALAAKLVEWCVRSADDRVIDPSFGGMVFLELARERLSELAGPEAQVGSQLYGVDLDEAAFRSTPSQGGLEGANLMLSDFFLLEPEQLPQFAANIGNPPYIRYQAWNGNLSRAHAAAEAMGVKLSRLSSIWAPFVIHGCRFLARGGRLGQVLPAELLHAQYARPVMEFLIRSFRSLTITLFEERVFPGAQEEILLLFGEGYGEGPAPGIGIVEYEEVGAFELDDIDGRGRGHLVPDAPLLRVLSPDAQRLYERLSADERVGTLGTIAEVDIGAVTGANDFFLRTRAEIAARAFEPDLFQTAVSRAADIVGARLDLVDIEHLAAGGCKTELLVTDGQATKLQMATIDELIEEGESLGVHARYKCRVRTPWWSVPLPRRGAPDALLTYMNDGYPRLAYNEARALSTNTLHNVCLVDSKATSALAVGFYNSLTLLSAELVGRSYGGGILKLEPTEAERLVLPPLHPSLGKYLSDVDKDLRTGDLHSVLDLVDPLVLEPLGVSREGVETLRLARETLRGRRRSRSKRNGH